jgi:dihydroorotase
MPSKPDTTDTFVLRGGHVIDPAQDIDGLADVLVSGGRIAAVGRIEPPAGARFIDVAGHYVTPGWIDLHVHVYGTLGFADPDSIGVCQGVTTYVEAGGPGIDTLDEFLALLHGRTRTSLFVGPYLRPMGIIGLNFLEGDPRSLGDVPIARWLDFVGEHPGLVRYLKIGAFGRSGTGPLKIAKGLAQTLGVPLYVHIGEHQMQEEKASSYEVLHIADAGDIITHAYHNNNTRLLDRAGKVLPAVRAAQERGVLFDIGFGGYNFSWQVAEAAYAQGFAPDIISSDLQQFNVIGPTFSLAHVLGAFLHLGLSVREVIDRVTAAPARALALADTSGTLRPGRAADITVFRTDHGTFPVADTSGIERGTTTRVVPVMTFKGGERIDADMTRCADEHNWIMQIAEEGPPAAAAALAPRQRQFLDRLADALELIAWTPPAGERFDLDKAILLQRRFHAVRAQEDLELRAALLAVYGAVLERPFHVQIGLFLLRLERRFVVERLRAVARGGVAAGA